jgi:hypothetical protein
VDIYIECYIVNYENETYDGPLAGLCHELEKMAGQNVTVVETIELLIWVKYHDFTRLGELDDILGSPEGSGWPALREVSLSFIVSENDSDKALRNLPMTKLVESKRVQFDFQVKRGFQY